MYKCTSTLKKMTHVCFNEKKWFVNKCFFIYGKSTSLCMKVPVTFSMIDS